MLFILTAMVIVQEQTSGGFVQVFVFGYGAVTLLALGLALARRGSALLVTVFVISDAALVVALFHEHLFASENRFEHRLSASALAIGFLLLAQVALRLRPWLVSLFAGIVVAGWLSLLAVSLMASSWEGEAHRHDWIAFPAELALASAFAFAALVCNLLTKDHDALLMDAIASETRRQNLARFFAPSVLSELETKGRSLALTRRRAAVMFIDLRSFSGLSEALPPEEVADLLAEYRQVVTEGVFKFQGTVDKFIGDGVMAVFGQPSAAPTDASRALQCALELSLTLQEWRRSRLREGKAALTAGIGLHVGSVIGGVLRSGTHHEFTVIGDAVNIAERLERLSKTLDASLVASEEAIKEQPPSGDRPPWIWKDAVELDGRSGRLRIAYILRSESKLESSQWSAPFG